MVSKPAPKNRNAPWQPGMVVFENILYPELVMMSHSDPQMRMRAMAAHITNVVLHNLTHEDRTDESQSS